MKKEILTAVVGVIVLCLAIGVWHFLAVDGFVATMLGGFGLACIAKALGLKF